MDIRLLPAAAATWVAAWFLTRTPNAPHLTPWVLAATVALTVLLTCANSRITNQFVNGLLTHTALALIGILVVMFSVNSYQIGSHQLLSGFPVTGNITLTGKVITEPRQAPFGGNFNWTMQEAATHSEIEVTSRQVPFRAIVQVTGTTKPSDTDAKAVAKLTSSQISVVQQPKPWWRITNRLRESLMQATAGLSPQARGLVPGMAIGDTSRVTPELKTAFKVSGLAHLTAVSGGHFAVILVALTYLTGVLRLGKWLRISLFAFVSTAFVMLVRPDPAVIRAAAMCAVSIVGTMRGRKAAAIPALGASILVLLAIDPWLSRSYGFALSCSASGCLALFATPFSRKLTSWLGEKLAYLIAVPAVAQAGCAPILLLFTNGAATTTVLANLLVGPAVAPATLLSLAATLIAPLAPALATLIAKGAAIPTWWIAWVATRCAALPFALLPIPGGVVGALSLALAMAVMGVLVWRWQPKGWPESWRQYWADWRKQAVLRSKAGWRRFQLGIPNSEDNWFAFGAFGLALLLLFGLSAGATKLLVARSGAVPGDWQVAACDVGQGDSTVIRTGTHSAIVIDVGNDDGAADHCLTRLHINQIDLLVLSHYHSDHVGGLAGVLAGRSVGAAIGPGGCGGEAAQVYRVLVASGTMLQPPGSGLQGAVGNVNWTALGHFPADANQTSCSRSAHSNGSETELNDHSLVFIAGMGTGPERVSIIALGDLETAGQGQLLGELRAQNLAGFNLVKVAHHGSAKQSPALVQYLHPDAAIFSAGAHNTYGHPTTKALDLYQQVGATPVRTDQCGTAVFAKHNGNLELTCLN